MVNVGFSVNMCDKYGDKFDDCLLLHINDNIILRLSNLQELDRLINQLKNIRDEIDENN
jgi:hypothetical protein